MMYSGEAASVTRASEPSKAMSRPIDDVRAYPRTHGLIDESNQAKQFKLLWQDSAQFESAGSAAAALHGCTCVNQEEGLYGVKSTSQQLTPTAAARPAVAPNLGRDRQCGRNNRTEVA